MCIPTHDRGGKVNITSTPYLKGLVGFDPKDKYGPESYKGREVRLMTKKGTQMQMGIISNLITDMTLTNYDEEDLAAAVRHSMVVIDAHKHKLDYKRSEIDNNIAALHKKYQGKVRGGASTIISRASGEDSVEKRKGSPKINKKGTPDYDPSKPEGALIWKTDPDAYYTVSKTNKRTGEVTTETRVATQKITKMAKTDDAYTLVSEARHPMEIVYADHANFMKSLANKARKELAYTGKIEYDANAKRIYQPEVDSLMTKLNIALLNAPRERAATRMANAEIQAKKQQGLLTDKGDEKKAAQRAVSKYRAQIGAVKRSDRNIEITDREWEAIQAGAISEHKLKQILDNTDVDSLRQRATPRATTTLSQGKISKIKAMNASSYTIEEIARSIGVSPSTVSNYLKGAN
jgi:DNA-binding CsgD family transcriptional regulator